MPALLITVRFHDGRYHGRPDWPPSPARLYQALVAGAARGRALGEEDKRALAWLEALEEPPVIAAPHHREGQSFSNYVPNNDRDAVEAKSFKSHRDYMDALAKIRSAKLIKPTLFDEQTPFLYLWRFEDAARAEAQRVRALAEGLYQLGRGVDMAWATGEILNDADAEARLADYSGVVHRPSGGGEGRALAAPTHGSLDSLVGRHKHKRFERVLSGRKEAQLFRQPPKPIFRHVAYDSPPARLLFDLIGEKTPAPLASIAALTEQVRDLAARKLNDKLPHEAGKIERCLVGRGADEADKARRVRIIPLPSIGHPQVTPAIRRVLVEIPAACPLRADDIAWAFSGLELVAAVIDPTTGEVKEQRTLTAASDHGMLRHYGIGERATVSRLWRTITPAALPATRRRLDPNRLSQQRAARTATPDRELKKGAERAQEERHAVRAVMDALRQAGAEARVGGVRVQREPFAPKGERAEAFAHGRFPKERLWHVEVSFSELRSGPLVLGDGRFLGLGLAAPVARLEGALAFDIVSGLSSRSENRPLTEALRRAVMARAAAHLRQDSPLPVFFSGHESSGEPARSGRHRHLAYAFDSIRTRLFIIAPHLLERRAPAGDEPRWLNALEQAAGELHELRAGRGGRLLLRPTNLFAEADPLLAPHQVWESLTPFRVVRHIKAGDARAALQRSLLDEVRRLGLPRPHITVLSHDSASGTGLSGRARLTFPVAIQGPLILGRDRHFGGGLFCHAEAYGDETGLATPA